MRWPWSRRAPEADATSGAAASATSTADASASAVAKATAPTSMIGGGGFAPQTTEPSPTKPAGADGVSVLGGFLVSNERDPRLHGTQKWVTYDNQVLNVAVIAAAVNIWTQLGGSATWSVVPNKRGGKDAQRAADLVTDGLLEAQLSTPWRQVVRRQLMKKFRGFAMHEIVYRRGGDGRIVIADLQDRPQWTIWRWNRPDPQAAWIGVEQLIPLVYSKPYYIPRERLLYSVENTLSPTPDGVGLLRQMAESTRVLELYQRWEGVGFQTDLRGVPVARAPIAEIQAAAGSNKTAAEQQAAAAAQTQFLTNFLFNHNKTDEQGVLLDSSTYRNRDPASSVSSIYKWAFDLIKGASSSMPEVGTAIGRITRDIARVMCAEWLLLGGEDSGGAYSMHADKTAMFGLVVNSALGDVADDATRDIATPLVALNGMDPETCTPRLVPEPIAIGAVSEACKSLMLMAQSALDPRDPAINILRARLDLPPAPEVDESMMILSRGQQIVPVDPSGKPDGPPIGGKPAPGAGAEVGTGEAGNPSARPDAAAAPAKEAT